MSVKDQLPIKNSIVLKRLLPHREPMLLVDALISCEEDEAIANFTIEQDHILVIENVFSEFGIIENMAQTAALHSGYSAAQIPNTKKVGLLAAINTFSVFTLPVVGDLLVTQIRVLMRFGEFSKIDCACWVEEKKIAEATLTLSSE